MGSSIRIVIGPYIEVNGTKEVKETKTQLACPNRTCYNHINKTSSDKIRFCPECGTEISYVIYDEIENISPADLFNEFEDTLNSDLYNPGYLESIFISNEEIPFGISSNLEEENIIDLSMIDMNAQIKWMEETYKEEINLFIENFGKDSVFVKWGIISYWS